MILRRHLLWVVPALLFLAPVRKAQNAPKITDISTIPLQNGVNNISSFGPDGSDAQIVSAWRDNGNAHGYNVFMVLIESSVEPKAWAIAGIDDPSAEDVIRDNPHTGEDSVRSVRFGRGRVDGTPSSPLISAERQFVDGDTYESPMFVKIDIYKLGPTDGAVGEPLYRFTLISETLTLKRFCNADLALFYDLGLPLPNPYEGVNEIDGCP